MSFNTIIKGFRKAGLIITQGFAQARLLGLKVRICRLSTSKAINMTIKDVAVNGICRLSTVNGINMDINNLSANGICRLFTANGINMKVYAL